MNENSSQTVKELSWAVYKFYKKHPAQIGDGQTPLHFAVHTGRMDIFQNILARMQDKNPKDENEVTPLCVAAYYGHWEMYQLLIGIVEDKNPNSNDGGTPLHDAAIIGHLSVFQLILEKVDDKNPKDNYRWTPLKLAKRGRFTKIQKLIEDGIKNQSG